MIEPVIPQLIVNPYPQRYPKLHAGFVDLQKKLELPWYGRALLLNHDRSEAIDNFLGFSTLVSVLVGLPLALSAHVEPNYTKGDEIFCLLPMILLFAFWFINWRTELILQRRARLAIQSYVDSIPNKSLLEITVLLRDFAKVDPVMSAKAEEYRKSKQDDSDNEFCFDDGTGEMALYMIKHPSPINTFRAVEYLLANYPYGTHIDVGDNWGLDYFETISRSNTYYGFLESVEKDNRISNETQRREALELAAQNKLAALQPINEQSTLRSA